MKFFFVDVSSLQMNKNDKIKMTPCCSPNELGYNHHGPIHEKETTRHSMPPNGSHNSTSEAALPTNLL